jgi:hypothetical protein
MNNITPFPGPTDASDWAASGDLYRILDADEIERLGQARPVRPDVDLIEMIEEQIASRIVAVYIIAAAGVTSFLLITSAVGVKLGWW